MIHRAHRNERGQSLVIVLSLITLLFLLGSALAVHGSVALRSTRTSAGQGNDFYAADAATELGIWWQRQGKPGNPPAQTINGLSTTTTISGGCRPVTPIWLTGFEYGSGAVQLSQAGGGLFNTVTNVATPAAALITAPAAAARNGSYGLKIVTQDASNYAYGVKTTTGAVRVARFSFAFASLPSPAGTNADLVTFSASGGNSLVVMYLGSTQKLALRIGGGTPVQASNALTAGTWYSFDIRFNVGTNPRRAEWQLNRVDQTDVTSAEATAANVSAVQFGAVYAGTAYTSYVDDVVLSSTSSDFPMTDSAVLAVRPDGTGTHSQASRFDVDSGGANLSNLNARVDDAPMTSTADYLIQVTAASGAYAEVTFANTAEACVRGASAVVAYHGASSLANNGQTHVITGSDGTVQSGAMTGSALSYASAIIGTGSGTWTTAILNAVTARMGYSTDVSPNPYWDALVVEYLITPSGNPTVTVVGTGGGSSVTTTYADVGPGTPALSTWAATK